MNSCGAVGTSTRAVACALAGKPQLKCTIDICRTPHLHRLVEIDHTVGAVVAVQKLWRDLTMADIAEREVNLQKKCLASCVLRDDHKAHLACGCRRRRSGA